MNVLVIGNGGREHALIWKIKQSQYVEQVFCAPGNGGIAQMAACADIRVDDFRGLIKFAREHEIDLTVVGPELPLTLGITDAFQKEGLTVFGPTKAAAILEGSKVFAKDFLKKYNIPSAAYEVFSDTDTAVQHIHETQPPYVLKADGLAAGKGVLICHTRDEALQGVHDIMKIKKFGEAGNRLVIEAFMIGEEASILAITDGERFVILPTAQDHKAIFDGDTGPNTGGMGAYSPAPIVDDTMLERIKAEIIRPTIDGMKAEGRLYTGVLYAGLMITEKGPEIVEYNCRFGDPEIQAVLPILKTDLVDLMLEACDGKLKEEPLELHNGACMCVVMASGGYPGSYEKGKPILGLDEHTKDAIVFHAGTKAQGDEIVTAGGRVLDITAKGDTLREARDRAYEMVGKITFDGAYYRKDIGHRAL